MYIGEGRPFKGTKVNEVLSIDNFELMAFSNQRKLILRPLSDMTEEESKESRKIFDSMVAAEKLNCEIEAARTLFALSKGFDLFNLIESGLAIKKSS